MRYLLCVMLLLAVPVGASDKYFDMSAADPVLTVKDRALNTILKSDTSDFSIKAWGDECEMKIMAPQKTGKMKLYTLEGGNLEWEIVLASKPASNVFTYTIQTKGLIFHYQPKLTQQEIDMGADRPDSVVGSYAIYHSTKRGNIRFRKDSTHNYGTGKAFHIYRPKAFDKTDTVWCELNISGDQLRITVPQSFLDGAVYPITIDPQFGNTTPGGTLLTLSGYRAATTVTMAASSGQVLDSVVVHARFQNAESTLFGAIYEDDTGPGALGEGDVTGIAINSATPQWWEIPMAGTYALTASATYWLAMHCANIRVSYDGNTNAAEYVTPSSSFPDPWGSTTQASWILSHYGVYSAAPVTTSGRRRRILGGGQ